MNHYKEQIEYLVEHGHMPNEEQAKEDEVKPMTLSDLSLEDLKEWQKNVVLRIVVK